jgi:hypothetical protein
VSFLAPNTCVGNWPDNLLLLRSSSKKYGMVEICQGMSVKLLELAWFKVVSVKWV